MEQGYTIICALVDISNTLVYDELRMPLQRNVNVSHMYTFFSSVESKKGNTFAHIYCNDMRWKRSHPMKYK